MSHRTCGTTATMLTTQVSTGRYLSPTHVPLSLNPYLAVGVLDVHGMASMAQVRSVRKRRKRL